MKKNRLSALAIIAVTGGLGAFAAPLTVEDFCDVKLTAPRSVEEMHPLSDGETYSAISEDGKKINVYSYRTGAIIKTLFDVDAVKGDLKIEEFEGYEISGNEKKILLWNSSEKIYRHSFRAKYYVYDIFRQTLKEVSAGTLQQGAVISHDGTMVAYMRDNNIFISNLDYGTDRAITEDGAKNKIINGTSDWGYEEEFGVVNTMRWSPDDSTLAYVKFNESKVPAYQFDIYSGYCDPIEEYNLYPGTFEYKYPLAGFNNSIVSVHVYNLDNRVTKTMDLGLQEKDYVPSMEFGGSSDRLMVMVLNRDQNDLRLYRVDPASTVANLVYSDKSKAWLSPAAYQMVDYGSQSFVIGSERTGWRHLYEYSYTGDLKRTITSGDYNVTDYYGRDKLGNVYLQCTKLGAINRNVAKVNAKGVLSLLNNAAGTESASFSRNFSYYVRTFSNAVTPPQYTVCKVNGGKIHDIELNAEYAARYTNAPRKEFLTVNNAAGEPMNAYIIKPADFDPSRKYPLLMTQYNGPDSQEVRDMWKMEGVYYLAQEGYIVAAVDGRGTGNRSREWANIVYKNLGHYETLDQIAGAEYFASLPYIDSSRLACFGWSYGGYMTLMELGAKNSPFKAGVAMAPVTDWRFYDSIYTERYMLTPQQNSKGYDDSSALNHTADMNANLLIMSGTADDNVHFYQTLKYTSKLTNEGKLFDMMAYTGFEHSCRMCNARTMIFRKIKDFLDTRLK